MRKRTVRKHWKLLNPRLPVTETHARDLALQTHSAVAQIDTELGCNEFIRHLTVCTAAMEVDKTHDKYSRDMIRSAILIMESVIKTGKITATQEAFIKNMATLITQWLQEGRITYLGFTSAKKALKKSGFDTKNHLDP